MKEDGVSDKIEQQWKMEVNNVTPTPKPHVSRLIIITGGKAERYDDEY